jgi:2-(S)-hydroxypropyl-CoM dehydrogenase
MPRPGESRTATKPPDITIGSLTISFCIGDGVRVNAVCPGTVAETAMGKVVVEQKIELGYGATPEEVVRRGAESFPLRRVGTVEDVVAAVLFLVSESSNWITGESINIDGGSLAG